MELRRKDKPIQLKSGMTIPIDLSGGDLKSKE